MAASGPLEAATAPRTSAPILHASYRIHRLRRHRDHRRNLRAFDPVPVRPEIPPRARALRRLARQGLPDGAEDQRRGAARRPPADRVHDARRQRIERDRQALERARARHVPALRRAARAGTGAQVEPRDGPRPPERRHRGIQDADRGDQLLARARRRPVRPQPGRGRRDPGGRVAQRQDADEPLPGDAVRREGGELSADPRGFRARQAAVGELSSIARSCSGCRSTRSASRRSATSGARAASTPRPRTAATRSTRPRR